MVPLTLLAASGLASEVLAATAVATPGRRVRILDDDLTTWGSMMRGARIEGSLNRATDGTGGELLACAGSGVVRRRIIARLAALGIEDGRYGRCLHPTVDIAPGCSVGAGSILLAQSVLTANVHLGSHVVVMPHVTLTHDDTVEDFATLCAGVALGGGVRVRSGAYLGMNATVREGVTIGRDAVLGMGAVLLEDLPAGETWAGVPARPLRSSMAVAN